MTRRFGRPLLLWMLLAHGCDQGPASFGDQNARVSSPARLDAPSTLDLARLANTEDCADCHADVASHWIDSAHAYSSFDNPWYRASVDDFRRARGERASRFCAGCHDPLLLLSGDIDQPVDADNELASAGITCLVCHSVESAEPHGNGSLRISEHAVLIPDPGAPEEVEAHRRRLSMTPLRTASLCGSCHRSFSGPAIGNAHHLPGIDDLGDWNASVYAGNATHDLVEGNPASCQGCHMEPVESTEGDMAASAGMVRNHRWAAAHTALAAQVPDVDALSRVEESLHHAVRVDVGQIQSGDRTYVLPEEASVRPGETLVADVVLDNTATGHRFPGGTRDMHDVWVEVDVVDGSDTVLGTSRPDSDSNDDVFLLRATILDRAGDPEILHQVHRFAAPAFDRTLPPHDAQIVRYEIELGQFVPPVRIEARLMHRKHNLAFQRLACAASRTPRGRQFAEHAQARGKVALDPCEPQPVTTVASTAVTLGAASDNVRSKEERLFAQSVGLMHARQEHLDRARPPLLRVRELGVRGGSDATIARADLLLGRLAGLQGRPDDAARMARQAEMRIGPSPSIDRVRGDAYAQAWRWEQALKWYTRALEGASRDPSAWASLARAHGSLGQNQEALRAADAGLALAPHHPALLRSRALALAGLDHPEAAVAEQAWLAHRKPDEAPALLAECEQAHVRCRTDRQPIPRYALHRPTKAIQNQPDPR